MVSTIPNFSASNAAQSPVALAGDYEALERRRMEMAFTITEHQGEKAWPSNYRYIGRTTTGLHEFLNEDGKPEFFAKRKSVSGWHLRRGQWSYEFCSSCP
jgi:hypothetical protein